jgi:hypothetical protein
MNTLLEPQYDYEHIGTFTRPVIDEAWIADQQEPVVPYHILMQNEVDALREEVKSLRSQLLFPNSEPKFLGFPVRHYNDSEDDLHRTTWEAFVCGQWHVILSGPRWSKEEAMDSIVRILKKEAGL